MAVTLVTENAGKTRRQPGDGGNSGYGRDVGITGNPTALLSGLRVTDIYQDIVTFSLQ